MTKPIETTLCNLAQLLVMILAGEEVGINYIDTVGSWALDCCPTDYAAWAKI